MIADQHVMATAVGLALLAVLIGCITSLFKKDKKDG